MELGWETALDTQQAPPVVRVAAGPEDPRLLSPVGNGSDPSSLGPHCSPVVLWVWRGLGLPS